MGVGVGQGGSGSAGSDALPVRVGRALLRADVVLRLALGVLWLLAACAGGARSGGWCLGASAALGLCGVALLAGALPRLGTAAGGVVTLAWLGSGFPLGGGLGGLALAGALARLALRLGPGAEWLERVGRLSRERTLHLFATELGRSRATRAADAEASKQALARAGDAYERAGRARAALERLGAGPGFSAAWVRGLAAAVAGALGVLPPAHDALERALQERSRSRSSTSA